MKDSHNRVETEREIPKLNCVACQMGRLICAIITETDTTCARIQYGTQTVQTTTNNLGYKKGKFTKVRDRASTKCNSMRGVCKLFGYGNIKWYAKLWILGSSPNRSTK